MDEPRPPAQRAWNISLVLTAIVQAIVAAGLVVFLAQREWRNAFFSGLTIALTLAPALISKRFRLFLPPELQLVMVLFVFLSAYAGSVGSLYARFWWWDEVLHASAGIFLSLVGFVVVVLLNGTDTLRGLRPVTLVVFSFTFAVTMGVLWEIYEFAIDRLIPGMNAQNAQTGVVDTMTDLIANALGALVVSLLGSRYLKKPRSSFLVDGIRNFIRRNPRLFRRHGGQSE